MSSETQSTSIVETLQELETLLALMRGAQVAIVEMPGLKIVMHPDQPAVAREREADKRPEPAVTSMHDDPMMYSDGVVPTFGSR